MPSIFTVKTSQRIQAFQNVWTRDVCRWTVIISLNIFKKVRIPSGEEKKRYCNLLRMNVPGHYYEPRVIAHAAIHGYQGIDAGISRRRKQARNSAPTPAHHSDGGQI